MKHSNTTPASSNVQQQTLPVIAGHEIAMDEHGRFNLNTIHKASDAGQTKRPSVWRATKQAQELIGELEDQSQNSGFAPLEAKHGGKSPGTFAHELLAVSYAGWISARFQLQVNQVFLDYRMGNLQAPMGNSEASHHSTLIGTTIGTDGFRCLAAVLDGKLRHLPAPTRKRAKHHVWQQVHKAFSVVSAEDIPIEYLDSARNFIGSYTLEGEWIKARPEPTGTNLDDEQLYRVWFLMHHFSAIYRVFQQYKLYESLTALGSRAGIEMIDHFIDGNSAVHQLKALDDEFDAVQRRNRLNQYA